MFKYVLTAQWSTTESVSVSKTSILQALKLWAEVNHTDFKDRLSKMQTTKTTSLLNSAETDMQNINLKYKAVHPVHYHHLTLARFFSE